MDKENSIGQQINPDSLVKVIKTMCREWNPSKFGGISATKFAIENYSNKAKMWWLVKISTVEQYVKSFYTLLVTDIQKYKYRVYSNSV